ncbi:MAG: hypothetical protein RL434_468 [Pseudomonadota bacterium]|jgi:hypothetical protein
MKMTTRALVLVGLCLMSSLSHAVPITRSFSATGFLGGGTLSGSFTGEDTGGLSGVIEASLDPLYNELTAFEASYSGGTEVTAFSLDLNDFLAGTLQNMFKFFISDESLGFVARSGDYGSAYFAGAEFLPFAGSFGLVADGCQLLKDGSCGNFDTNYSVPEPTTLSLLGLAVVGLMRRRARLSRG